MGKLDVRLGKIEKVNFGIDGYQGSCLGLFVTISCGSICVMNNKSMWDYNLVEYTEDCKWTEDDRDKEAIDIMKYISNLLQDAKVLTVDELKGIPIEATFDGMILKSWRILTEVL